MTEVNIETKLQYSIDIMIYSSTTTTITTITNQKKKTIKYVSMRLNEINPEGVMYDLGGWWYINAYLVHYCPLTRIKN